MSATTQTQQDISNQILPSNFVSTFYSPMGLALLISIVALVVAKSLDGRGRSSKLARARWAGARERTAARKLAMKLIQKRKHNRVALYVGTPKGATFEEVGNKRIINLPEDSSILYLPEAQRGIFVCGGPGGGKTKSMINPLLWSAIDQGIPIILYDFKFDRQKSATEEAKGQAPQIAGYAAMRGYEVSILAPGFQESCVANPLDFLRSETDAEMARQLAIVLNKNFKLSSGGDSSESGFFVNAGDQLAQAIFMLAKGTNFPDIMMCHAILSLPKLIERIQQADLNPWVRVAFEQFLSVAGSPETAASIVGTASGLFTRFMTPSTLSAFCGQTNIPLDLKGRKMVVFGMDKEKRDVIAPLLVSILHLLCTRNLAGKRTDPLVLALDELPTLYLPALVDWLNQNREDGLISILGLQNLSQLEKAYSKETTNAIFGGCATKIIFNPQDDVAAERFSNFLGDEQIRHKERSRSFGGKGGASTSISEQNTTRKLFEISQFNSLPPGRAVIISPGFRSGKDVGLPLLEQIPENILPVNCVAKSIKKWYEVQQKIILRSTLREPSGEELERRRLEAERLLPIVDNYVAANDRMKNI
ncbi:type IV secretory system conjugative DNA transfer family protein [Nostoc spongiaeforme FACHB-130]|uniref:Type IV secretory system conjugative DNA transfer family protein n=1 Tax=Nostoc spongiaeforme FACHB-130 TaxID=1357510 RepID=A0ABR8FXD5_9NOSO|nr:type IV secretion system DNA-binding domain-containing protein [Nostoc spongiaeforme]MBD2596048.1 type IV secretory system conjugative DNA transfer family protein [Nostoc spongiaeforme FACHB-130]